MFEMKFIVLIMALLAALAFVWMRSAQAAVMPQVGQMAPDFSLSDQNGKLQTLADYRGKWLVLYFYPKDETPACTTQACSFRDDIFKLRKLGAEVAGVSIDDASSHAEFAKKHGLPFPLLADKDGVVAGRYDSVTNLLLFKLAKRNTFIIDPQGKIAKVYRGANAGRNSEQVLADLPGLQAAYH
jgi:peroxiredoxin Q/BCP